MQGAASGPTAWTGTNPGNCPFSSPSSSLFKLHHHHQKQDPFSPNACVCGWGGTQMIQELQESRESKVLTLTNHRFPTRTFSPHPTGPKEQQGDPLVLTGHQLPSELFDLTPWRCGQGQGLPEFQLGTRELFCICHLLLPSAIRFVCVVGRKADPAGAHTTSSHGFHPLPIDCHLHRVHQ